MQRPLGTIRHSSRRQARPWLRWGALALLLIACQPQRRPELPGAKPPKPAWEPSGEVSDGLQFEGPQGHLKLEVCTEDIIRVMVAKQPSFFRRQSLATEAKRCDPATAWSRKNSASQVVLTTRTLEVVLSLQNGSIAFNDRATGRLLQEQQRTFEPVSIQGEQAFSVRQTWTPNARESFYGLGQHQQGLLDISAYPLSLVQYNTQIVVPVVVSSQGYGIFWDNTSWTRWGDLEDFESLSENQPAFERRFTARHTGAHIFRTYSSGAIELEVDGEAVIQHYRQGWLPGTDLARVQLRSGQSVDLALKHTADMGVNISELAVKRPSSNRATSLWSQVADGIDYYFIRGPEIDQVVAGYRSLTGQAPLPPKWAFGLWQSRERYKSAKEVLEVLAEFRRRRIPIDNIVQDWQFWRPGRWGSHQFDSTRFPDPKGFIDEIHETYNAQLMLSVWPKFHAGTANYQALRQAGHLYPNNRRDDIKDFRGYRMSYYDAFSAQARDVFWSQLEHQLLSLGVDAWWMDATEPEVVEGPYKSPDEQRRLYQEYMHPTALGSGSRMLNAYSLMNSKAVYEGQRRAQPGKRVFILTRSAFAGQQAYASASWSGDVTSTWTALKKQIPAGLGFSVSGIPYWTMDVGGFAVPKQFRDGDTQEWFELNTRWFQFGTFVPLLRVHGQHPPREMWTMGGDEHIAYQAHVKFTRLRYRLLPYLYSLAGKVTHEAYTLMRPLVMDFRHDSRVRGTADQYMFGPAFLVNPVTDYQARSRKVVLPQSVGGWYDFWTGKQLPGGQTIEASAPLESMPLFVRAGSIVPVGPELQYTADKPAELITLYVYSGKNGKFSLYEDDGTSYAYENGAHARIQLSWSDSERKLSIGAREGKFDGMLTSRRFAVVLVSPDAPVGFDLDRAAVASIDYDGEALEVRLP